MRQDLLYATRILLRWPGFAIAAILSLALGIGVTTAIFTVANGARAGRSPTPTWKHDRWSSGGPAEERTEFRVRNSWRWATRIMCAA
jgi:hypothetical protein